MNDATQGTRRDEDLARRAKQGDAEATSELFERYRERLRAKVGKQLPRLLRSKVGESDVIQEAFLTAFSRLAEFGDRGEGSFGAWLRRILDFKIKEEVRRYLGTVQRDARREDSPWSQCDLLPPTVRTPSRHAIRREELEAFDAARAKLSEDHRSVLRLLYEEDSTLEEAAQALGRSRDAVRKLYARAVAALAASLAEAETGS
jgi:RNA polymerase sigma-70 factor (ECF subfamily)